MLKTSPTMNIFFKVISLRHRLCQECLIIESMAQTAALLVVHSLGEKAEGKLVYFMSIDRARFRKPVIPGDQMIIHVDKQRNHGKVWKFVCKVTVEQVLTAEARITAMIMDKK